MGSKHPSLQQTRRRRAAQIELVLWDALQCLQTSWHWPDGAPLDDKTLKLAWRMLRRHQQRHQQRHEQSCDQPNRDQSRSRRRL